MKLLEKKRYPTGRRHLYLLGIKVFSYKKKLTKNAPKRSLLHRFFTYPLAVYDEYQRLKLEMETTTLSK